jgi:hypothetical protein
MRLWARGTAVITAIVVATSLAATARVSASKGDDAGNGTSDKQLAQDFKQSTKGAATTFVAGVRKLETTVGLKLGDGTITAAEVGPANYQVLVRELAAIGSSFDPVTSYPSNDAKLGLWALGVYAKRYDGNPKADPIDRGVALLFVAAALIFASVIYQSIGKTLFGPDGLFPSIDGVIPFLEPALRSFSRSEAQKTVQPLVSTADQQGIRDALAANGISGDALDGVTRMLALAASLMVADARR